MGIPLGDQASGLQQPDPIGLLQGMIEIVSTDQSAAATLAKFAQQAIERHLLRHIQAVGRFIEQQ
ncbi:hypothetical protein D3C77_687870 [compost metagenome]